MLLFHIIAVRPLFIETVVFTFDYSIINIYMYTFMLPNMFRVTARYGHSFFVRIFFAGWLGSFVCSCVWVVTAFGNKFNYADVEAVCWRVLCSMVCDCDVADIAYRVAGVEGNI